MARTTESGARVRSEARPGGPEAETQRWRDNLLRVLPWPVVAGTLLMAVVSRIHGAPAWLSTPMVACSVLIATGAAVGRWPFRLRFGLFFGGVFAAIILALATGVVAPNAVSTLAVLPIVATMLGGRRWGLAFALAGTMVITTVGVSLSRGWLPRPPNWCEFFDLAQPAVIVRVSSIFALVSGLGVLASAYLAERAERALRDRAASFEALEREIAEKERLRGEMEAREATVRRGRELELLGRLAGFAAHDFNNALLVIQAHCDLALAEADLAPATRESFGAIAGAARQAAATSKQLRAFTPDAGAPARRLCAADELDRAARMLGRLLPANVTIRCDLQSRDSIRADDGTFQGVITNLALNARDAMPAGGQLWFRARAPTAEERLVAGAAVVAIEVEDSGGGMDAVTLERAFEPFFTTKGALGTGLGLASVRETVERHGGRVRVSSTPGAGTRFTLLWPIDDAAVADAAPAQRARRLSGRILLVEDSDAVRDTLVRVLAGAGLTVVAAADTDEAVSSIRRSPSPFDLLLTDCILPGRPVAQLLEEYRATTPRGRVIMCSGYRPSDVLPADARLDLFMPKPFAPEALLANVHELLAEVPPREPGGAPFPTS